MAIGYGDAHWAVMLAFAVALALVLARTYILMHDCAHGSLFAGRNANRIVGHVLGCLCLTPFSYWRAGHLFHHGASGDLSRRGPGDLETATVDEFRS